MYALKDLANLKT